MPVVKTPGVYVEELSLFPPSVAPVATAVPAFVGYTEKAQDSNLNSLSNIPTKITSFLEFSQLFGGAYPTSSYTVKVDLTQANTILTVNPDKRFFLYDIARQYYDNGGGDCYIVSVGSYDDTIDAGILKTGIEALRKFDEPTLIAFPDGVLLKDGSDLPDFSNYADLQKAALAQCNDLKDRFTLMDIMQGNLKEDVTNKPISNFRDQVGVNFLSYGAAYYPWIISSYGVNVNFRQLKFIDQADADINNIAAFSLNANQTALVGAVNTQVAETTAIIKDIGEDVQTSFKNDIANNDLSLYYGGSNYINSFLSELESDARNTLSFKSKLTDYLQLIGTMVRSFAIAETALPASSPVKLEIPKIKSDPKLVTALTALVSLEKNPKVIDNTLSGRTIAEVDALYAPLDAAPNWFGGTSYGSIPQGNKNYAASKDGCLEIIADVKKDILGILLSSFDALLNAALFHESNAANLLFSNHPFFKGVSDKVTETMRTIPTSGSIAGVCALVDRSRGVWKAPANVSLSSVLGPAVKIDNREQDDLNVTATGKSINAIRAFTGKGTLIWGARTLAGNDNEWRYVPVRRFFIMVEESVKKASEPFVFEPNNATTWTKVRVMIENFLSLQWRAGALQGAKAEDAYFVNIGLDETMTADDILNGLMIVEIGMAVVRPAEFIILRFSHKMMEQ